MIGKARDFRGLVLGKHAGDDLVDARLALDGGGGAFVIPGQHHGADAHGGKLPNRAGARRLDDVGKRDDGLQASSAREEQRGRALVGERCRTSGETFDRNIMRMHHRKVSHQT